MRNVFGAKVKLVTGYPGGNDINLAMERSEVDGRCGWSWTSLKSQKNWLPQINVLVQFNLEKNADLPDVPVALERAANDEQRQVLRLLIAGQYVGRPFFTSPDIPAERKAALRAAFDATMKDPQFLADAAKLDLEISPISARRQSMRSSRISTARRRTWWARPWRRSRSDRAWRRSRRRPF